MRDIIIIWNDFIKKVLTDTFGSFLNEDEIKERKEWILSNLTVINPDLLYKNLVYMMNNNSISKLAIGYKLHFILDDWKELFNNPYTDEIDKNSHLLKDEKEFLDRVIDQFGNVINHHIESIIHNHTYNQNNDINDIFLALKDLGKFYELPNYNNMKKMYVESNEHIYKLNIGQILYFVVFNQNPVDGSQCDEKLATRIREHYHKRIKIMETLKVRWPTGIPLKYISSNIF